MAKSQSKTCDGKCLSEQLDTIKTEQKSASDSSSDSPSTSDTESDLTSLSDIDEKEKQFFPTSDIKMSTEELTQTVTEALQQFEISFAKARDQELQSLAALQESLENNTDTVNLRGGIRFPYFKGEESENVHDFLKKFETAAKFCNWSYEKMCLALPLYLQSDASIWLNNLLDDEKSTFSTLKQALIKQFDSTASHWRMRQTLDQRRQGPKESVADYIAAIRKACYRLKLPKEEVLNIFVRGLRSDLRDFVILNSPTDFETAQNLAKLKEATTSPPASTPSVSAIDYNQLAKTITDQVKTLLPVQPKTIATFQDRPTSNWSTKPNFQGSQSGEHQSIKRLIQQEIRKEMRNFQPQTYRNFSSRQNQYNGNGNFRSTTAQIYCTNCNRYGHSSFSCRRGNYQNDPRIPQQGHSTNRNWQARSNYGSTQNSRGRTFNSGQQQSEN